MAANIKDEEERIRRIRFVGEYFINNPDTSTRKAANYISANVFKISNYTVSEYLKLYQKLIHYNADELRMVIENNKVKTVDSPEVRDRVLLVAEKFLKENMTVEAISQELGESFWTIYRDLRTRLPKVNNELFKMVDAEMGKRSLNNLSNVEMNNHL